MNRSLSQPIQYQKGWTEFYKLRFRVTPEVLIPRPETELLIDQVLNFFSQQITNNNQPVTILDLGTGAGAIAISLAHNLASQTGFGKLKIIATDISLKALKVAQFNAKLHGVADKITFIESDLLSALSHIGCVQIIVTNLPYIPTARIPYLDSSVKDFEPLIALDGGEDGFELYRKLFKQIKEFSLAPLRWEPKLIVGEIDYTQGELAVLEAQQYFPDYQVEVIKDLARQQRFLIIKLPAQ